MEQEIKNFINDYIDTMTEEQIEHFKECAIKLIGKDDIVEAFNKFGYSDFSQLGILDYEEIQLLDIITDEIAYMREDDTVTEELESTEYEKLKTYLSNKGISLVDYKLHGDNGMPMISLYLDENTNKWVYQKPIERSNSLRQEEFDTFEDARKYIENVFI